MTQELEGDLCPLRAAAGAFQVASMCEQWAGAVKDPGLCSLALMKSKERTAFSPNILEEG